MHELASCANCWFNGLQHHAIGLSLGYCAEHRVVLRRADETTCARHLRKDLMHASALQQRVRHREGYASLDTPQRLADATPVVNGEYVAHDSAHLAGDPVGLVATEYGDLGTKIESLAQLRVLPGYRAELAMLSLARAYTERCCERDGAWTSGLHLLWWTRTKLADAPVPALSPTDFRYQTGASLERQTELAQWRLIMLRLVFISDVGTHAASTDHPVRALADLAEEAALATETPSLRKLVRWVKQRGLPALDAALPAAAYRALAQELHVAHEAQG